MKKFLKNLLFIVGLILAFNNAILVNATSLIDDYSIDKGALVQPLHYEDARNFKKYNYQILSDWYFAYQVSPGINTPIGSIVRTYNVFWRDVSYTVEYDVYDRYSGAFIRHVKRTQYTKEEDWRVVY
ncbi:hypothetical protein [Globicatella sanguinis]